MATKSNNNTWQLENKKIFGPLSTIKTFEKNEIILEIGKVEKHVSYLIKGCVALISYHDGNEICTNFFVENSFFSSYVSFLSQVPSEYKVIAINQCIVEQINYNSLETVYSISADHQKNGRKIAENLYIKSNERILSLLTKSAEERYLSLMEEHPRIVEQMPLKYLATYLGITPVSLSRIRNKITKS